MDEPKTQVSDILNAAGIKQNSGDWKDYEHAKRLIQDNPFDLDKDYLSALQEAAKYTGV